MLFHKGNVRRNDSLGTALHKVKHLLLGWRVKVIKKDTPNASPFPTMGYKKVIVTPGKQSKAKSGIKGEKTEGTKINVSVSTQSTTLD